MNVPTMSDYTAELMAKKNDGKAVVVNEPQQQMPQEVQRTEQYPQEINPFQMQQYQDVAMPDAPLTYGGGLAEGLLNNDEVPDKIQSKYWHVFHKDNVLTFLDEERKKSKLLNFDITKIDFLNSMPYYEYDFSMEKDFNILRNLFETKLDRAVGIKDRDIMNERKILQSQFTEQRQISEHGQQGSIKEGFFKRLLGRR